MSGAGPLAALANRIADINRANGWYSLDRSFGDEVALLHSEVSEAFEEYRKGKRPDDRYYTYREPGSGQVLESRASKLVFDSEVFRGKPEGVPSELADVLIRVLDSCYRYGIDIDTVVDEKLAFNATRGHRHGGKVV